MMVEERDYLLENAYKLFLLLSLTCLFKVLYICRLYFLLYSRRFWSVLQLGVSRTVHW
jgi:hypothetical protein